MRGVRSTAAASAVAGRNGLTLKKAWEAGPHTYLGLMSKDFPNLFMVTGPQSPSVLSNMIISIEQHVDWITDCLVNLRGDGFTTIEPTQTAQDSWVQHTNDYGDISMMFKANSWYVGANVPGKPRVFMPFVGGFGVYGQIIAEVAAERGIKHGPIVDSFDARIQGIVDNWPQQVDGSRAAAIGA